MCGSHPIAKYAIGWGTLFGGGVEEDNFRELATSAMPSGLSSKTHAFGICGSRPIAKCAIEWGTLFCDGVEEDNFQEQFSLQ